VDYRKRGTNGARQDKMRYEESPYVLLPWREEQDRAYEEFLKEADRPDVMECLAALLADGIAVKIGFVDSSVFATMDDPKARAAGWRPLLSGWSDEWQDAILVLYFKWDRLLGRSLDHPTPEPARSRRR